MTHEELEGHEVRLFPSVHISSTREAELRAASSLDVSRGSWKKNGALHSVIRVSDQAATSACSRTSLRPW